MTSIEVLEDFSDDGVMYRAGEVRIVLDDRAAFFCAAGWCRSSSFPTLAIPKDATLEVQNCSHVTGAHYNG